MRWGFGKKKQSSVLVANQDIIGSHYQVRIAESEKKNKKPKNKIETKKRNYKKYSVLFSLLIILGLAVFTVFYFRNLSAKTLPYPINKQTAQTLGYDIYYPDSKLLPSGFKLNLDSFKYSGQALIYTVSYGNNQKIVFSDQFKPSDQQLQTFYKSNLPLHKSLNTQIGTAQTGNVFGQTIVSLPSNTDAWLIITAPSNVNQIDLQTVLNSLKLAK